MVKGEVSEFVRNINIAVDVAGGVEALAAILGVSPRTVYAWKSGERSPTLAMYGKISAWLEKYPEKRRPDPNDGEVREDPGPYAPVRRGNCLAVPFHHDEATLCPVYFSSINPVYGSRLPEHLRFVRMTGRSMEPVLLHNDLCLLDTHDTALEEDGIYLIRHGAERYIRRWCPSPGGEWRFLGDNRSLPYHDFSLCKEDRGALWDIDGRIFWFCRSL